MKKAGRKNRRGRQARQVKPKAKRRLSAPRSLNPAIPRSSSSVIVCRCEEVSEADVRRVIRMGYHSLEAVKRILRTGMGHCQGRGCLKLVARMIQEETGIPASEQKLPFPRPPLKPLPLGLLGSYKDEA